MSQIGLMGGVFHNHMLTSQIIELLEAHEFTVYFSENVPCNDGELSFGQVIEYGASLASNAMRSVV